MEIDISCPRCGQVDLVQSVPAVHADGVSTSYGTNTYTAAGVTSGGLVPVVGLATVERTHTTALAHSLAREPARRRASRLTAGGVVLLLPAVMWLAAGIVSLADPEPGTIRWLAVFVAVGISVVLAVPGALVLGAAVTRMRYNAKVVRGQRAADVVWRAGFYCHRCGVGYWPQSPAPGVPARYAYEPHQFRSLVWNAGGYLAS